jgi:hypothetical protein
LTDPRKDHAVVMAKFANECLSKMKDVTNKLEVELGPDTAELQLRIGMHSGAVVAGVLRGDKSRFQLFGDTMNTASRMESTGLPSHIQISQETANLLVAAGKDKWVVQRDTKIKAKGKGELTTFFLKIGSSDKGRSEQGTQDSECDDLIIDITEITAMEEKRNRAANWTTEIMSSVLKAMVAARKAQGVTNDPPSLIGKLEQESLRHHADDDDKFVIVSC